MKMPHKNGLLISQVRSEGSLVLLFLDSLGFEHIPSHELKMQFFRLAMEAHTCNPSYLGGGG
jgi:hypothetical protein